MISIVIPVFNRDITRLATDLSTQLTAIQQGGEIVVMDDGSNELYQQLNAAVAQIPFVRYIPGTKNYGRIRIRQLLAETARYNWLLFLDCDSAIVSDQFLLCYFRQLTRDPSVCVGGRIYTRQPPGDCALRLHWQYGSIREAMDPGKRNKKPYSGFMSNNFLIHKNIFNKLQFTGNWQGYGHEDTWMGMQLEDLKAPVQYIHNVTLHEGLETAPVFIAKSESALHNLNRLRGIMPRTTLQQHVWLFNVFCRLQSFGLLWIPSLAYRFLQGYIKKNLHSCHPSLVLFDLYRLDYFIKLTKQQKSVSGL